MFPYPITIGPLNLNYYGLLVAAGVLAALALFSLTAPRREMAPGLARDFCFWMVLAGLLGSRFFYVIFHWPEFKDQWWDVFAYWRGGLMFQGGVVAALLVCPVFLKYYNLKAWPTADIMAPSLALGQCFGRIGCFSAGCCYGRAANLDHPLAVVFPYGSLAPAGIHLWPTQLFESLGLLALTIILVWAIRNNGSAFSRQGRVGALYLLGTGLLRLGLEMLRGDYRGDSVIFNLPPTTLTAITTAVAGLILFIYLKPKTRL